MSNKEIARKFASGATKGRSKNMFIDGDSIYSYGYHFKVASRLVNGKFWFNEEKYSSSTSRHQSIVRNACR